MGRGSATGASGAVLGASASSVVPGLPDKLAEDSGSPTSLHMRCSARIPAGWASRLAMARSVELFSSAAYLGSMAARMACRMVSGSLRAALNSGRRSMSSRNCGLDWAMDRIMSGLDIMD